MKYGEPWHTDTWQPGNNADHSRWYIQDAEGECIAEVEGIKHQSIEPEDAKNFSERIVACVNALAGVANPAAVAGAIEALRLLYNTRAASMANREQWDAYYKALDLACGALAALDAEAKEDNG